MIFFHSFDGTNSITLLTTKASLVTCRNEARPSCTGSYRRVNEVLTLVSERDVREEEPLKRVSDCSRNLCSYSGMEDTVRVVDLQFKRR